MRFGGAGAFEARLLGAPLAFMFRRHGAARVVGCTAPPARHPSVYLPGVNNKWPLLQEWVFKNTLVFVGQVRVCLTW